MATAKKAAPKKEVVKKEVIKGESVLLGLDSEVEDLTDKVSDALDRVGGDVARTLGKQAVEHLVYAIDLLGKAEEADH